MFFAFRSHQSTRLLFQLRTLRSCAMVVSGFGEKRSLSPVLIPESDKKRRSHSPEASSHKSATIDKVDGRPVKDNASPSRRRSRRRSKRERKHKKKLVELEPCSRDDVYWREVISLLGQDVVDTAIEEDKDLDTPFDFRDEVELEIIRMSSNGEGLSIAPPPKRPWVVIVPFSLPGEKVRARIYRSARLHSFADFLAVERPNSGIRDMTRVGCKYFEKCGGCQYQMLSYETQLELKRDVVVRAYETFSGLPSSAVPSILPTAPSPLQYGYRTKITPHFDAPVKRPRRNKGNVPPPLENAPEGKTVPIGFNRVGTREVLDIEECPIATATINEALGPLRKNTLEILHTYKKGASLLLRDSLTILAQAPGGNKASAATHSTTAEEHVCITDHRGTARERVGDKLFDFSASSFFQNNNSVLPSLVDYVKDAIFPSIGPSNNVVPDTSTFTPPTHLVDAYCGAGFFSIMLSPYFKAIAGIELSSESVAAATHNAQLNNLAPGRVTFRAGDAAHIFAVVPDFPASETAVIIDPPRKGCDENFLDQLLTFRSATVVYVSCNVHTQARDVGILLRRSADQREKGEKFGKYVLKSIRGFDLFPQTAHVESVAVLRIE